MAVVGTAGAANAAGGRLTLISGTGAATIAYSTCQSPRQYPVQQHEIDAFVNEPLPGCQAVLVNDRAPGKCCASAAGACLPNFAGRQASSSSPASRLACTF